jgi:acetylornithine/succinyldiaminopimelate/putrescine aminotransferase
MHGSTQANTACESSVATVTDDGDRAMVEPAIVDTCRRMIRERIPNLFRLYLNPHVAQTCYCLNALIESAWPAVASVEPHQVFLANSMEEALSGAIKLARYSANAAGRLGAGLVFDPENRLEHFAHTNLSNGERIEYIPGVDVITEVDAALEALREAARRPSFIVVFLSTLLSADCPVHRLLQTMPLGEERPLLIVCVDRAGLFDTPHPIAGTGLEAQPDIFVFDESFVDFEVPFGAFAASAALYSQWNRRGMATFHSTTYQPNTISTLHFMRRLEATQPNFVARQDVALRRIETDLEFRRECFGESYSPSLARLISAVDLDQRAMHAVGNYIEVSGGKLFDGVAGVACSVRGHNPPAYADELNVAEDFEACREEVRTRLDALTGLPHATPAVSGASAVELALKIALASQFPRTHVLALQGGYGGKTLFALTGTAKPSLKSGLDPLYRYVVYVDPFAADAIVELDAAFERHPIGVVQLELVQGVGGVRGIPQAVLEHLQELRRRYDVVLMVDEVQTAVYRTGPFVRSTELGVEPDLLTIGKGTSDMMFPFAMTLHSDAVERKLAVRGCMLSQSFVERYGYEIGYRTVLSTLRRAAAENFERQVRDRAKLLAQLLSNELRTCRNVSDVRCYGLLIGIELNVDRRPYRWLKKLSSQLFLLAMLHHRTFPVVVGFCQYEPHVLKLTPPLSITEQEIRSVCHTIATVLRSSFIRLAATGFHHAVIRPRLRKLRRFISRRSDS